MVVGKLDYPKYLKWQESINEMQKSDLNLTISKLELKLLDREAELAKMRVMLHEKIRLQNAKQKADESKVEYQSVITEMEANLGFSLDNKTIDPITLEIRDLDKPNSFKEDKNGSG